MQGRMVTGMPYHPLCASLLSHPLGVWLGSRRCPFSRLSCGEPPASHSLLAGWSVSGSVLPVAFLLQASLYSRPVGSAWVAGRG